MSKHAIPVDQSRPGPISLLTGQCQLIASRHGRGIRCKEDVRESSWLCILVNETLSQLQFHHDSVLQQATAIWAKQLFDPAHRPQPRVSFTLSGDWWVQRQWHVDHHVTRIVGSSREVSNI